MVFAEVAGSLTSTELLQRQVAPTLPTLGAHFPLTDSASAAFADPSVQVSLAIKHEYYLHMAGIAGDTRAALAQDLI